MTSYTATYSPDDNKLRLSASSRLDAETYNRLKDAGFKWAPTQEIFVAPMWTPDREDLLIELAGEIDDDDQTLIERAEVRAERFEDYSDKRGREAASAREGVQQIAGRFEFGQPILLGHHSERRARKDAERMESGMRRSIQLWDTSTYWASRAAGALAHAKYKELPAVRARRIKGLEADKRKQERNKAEAQAWLSRWLACEAETDPTKQQDSALRIAEMCWLALPRKLGDREDFSGNPTAYDALKNSHPNLYAPRTLTEILEVAKRSYPATISRCERWIDHFENRIAYERAMLGEQGGLKADQFDIQPGGRVLVRGEWLVVLRVNRRNGTINSVRTNARFVPIRQIEEISDYTPPTEDEAQKVATVTKVAPQSNYPGPGFVEMTTEEWEKVPKDYKGFKTIDATDSTARHRVRHCLGVYCLKGETDLNKRHRYPLVYLTDAKRKDPPTAEAAPVPVIFERRLQSPELTECARPAQQAPKLLNEEAEKMAAMRKTLAAGVQVVSAPQLFPTPPELAEQVAELAKIEDGMTLLEPSAGTGALLHAIQEVAGEQISCTAVELNGQLFRHLEAYQAAAKTVHADFLELQPQALGYFDRVVMNPPFVNAEDILHIEHAITFLKPGGRIVAICANGPRQNERLGALALKMGGSFEALPIGSFLTSGTNVRAAIFIANVRQTENAME